MKITKQVSSLHQSKQLWELGVKCTNNTLFYWVEFSDSIVHEGRFALCREASRWEESNELAWIVVGDVHPELQGDFDNGTANAIGMIYPAFTVAELLVMHGDIRHFFEDQSEASKKLSSLLIGDIVKGSIKVEDVNNRLNKEVTP